jgi:hypothetical protein
MMKEEDVSLGRREGLRGANKRCSGPSAKTLLILVNRKMNGDAAASHKSGLSCRYCFLELPASHRTQLAKIFRGRSRRFCTRKRRSFNFAFSSTRTFPTTRTGSFKSSSSSSFESVVMGVCYGIPRVAVIGRELEQARN